MRRLTRWKFAALLACGVAAAPSPLAAQAGKSRVKSEEPPQQGAAPREARPQPEALHVKTVSPELEAVLQEWYAKTKDITKLQGEHRRWKYEPVFGVAKVATGKFFFEAPDQGRIDLEPEPEGKLPDADPKQPGVQVRAGRNVYTLKADAAERWICDGKQIVQIHDAEKTFEVLPIPPQHQGLNIMDGPLPFLFGLPPEKAKQRYDMELGPAPKPDCVFLVVTPKLEQDARNWQRADVLLDRKTFLPTAVKLTHPDGEAETVFSFGKHEVNPTKILQIFTGSPFKPTLLGYKQVQAPVSPSVQPLTTQGKPLEGVPSVIGLGWKEASNVLTQRGFQDVKMLRGPVTKNPKLKYHVVEQSPAPKAAAGPDAKIVLTVYIDESDLQKDAAKPQQPSQPQRK